MLPSGRAEDAAEFANQGALGPETASLVKESPDLSRGTAVAGRETKEETVTVGVRIGVSVPGEQTPGTHRSQLEQVVRLDNRVLGLQRPAGVHLGQDLSRQGLLDLVDLRSQAG